MKKIYLLIAIFFFLFSCSKEADNEKKTLPEPEQNEEVILGENTIDITKEITNHITVPVTGMDIVLDNSINESELPKKGQILLQSEATEEFPFGFLGKVSNIEKTSDGYKIQTEKAYLDEAFEVLNVKGEMEVDLSEFADTRAKHEIGIGLYESDGYKGFQLNYTENFEKSSIKFNLSQGFIFQYTIDINNKIHKPFASFTLRQKTSISPSFNLDFNKGKNEVELFKKTLKTIQLTPIATSSAVGLATTIILRPEIEISLFGSAEGECTLNSSVVFDNYSIIGFEYKDGQAEFNWRSDGNPKPIVTADAQFSMNGSFYTGLKCELTAKLFSEKLVSLNMPFSIGPEISANLSIEDIGQKSYEELSDAYVQITPFLAKAGIEFNLFKGLKDTEAEMGVKAEVQASLVEEKKFHLLPKFNNMSFERGSQNKKTATVKSTVQQNLLFPVQIAYKLTSKKENFNKTSEWTEFQYESDMSNPYTHEYSDLKAAWDYTVTPLVKLPLFGEIEATPEKEIEGEIVVTTMEVTNQSSNIVTLFGQFDPEISQPPTIYGFCYSTTNKNPTIYDSHIQVQTHTEGKFQTTVSIEDDQTYYYRAYIFAEDGKYYYGDTKTYGSIIGKWSRNLQEDTYTLIETGQSTTYTCRHHATIEFKEDGSGVQTGAHTDTSEDTGESDPDPDTDWDPTLKTYFTWTQNGNEVILTIEGKEIKGTILQISNTNLNFSYPINTIPEEKAVRSEQYTRISQ